LVLAVVVLQTKVAVAAADKLSIQAISQPQEMSQFQLVRAVQLATTVWVMRQTVAARGQPVLSYPVRPR
jgi:prophage DNA circulation protein